MDSEDGKIFIKHLAQYVRTHEKALANALQLQRRSVPARPSVVGGSGSANSPTTPTQFGSSPNTSNALAAAFSLPSLTFTSQSVKPVKLSLTPHHLFYLLHRFSTLNISVGNMDVRLKSLRTEQTHTYEPFLQHSTRRSRQDISSDSMSIHSVASVRSVMSGVSTLWSSFLGGPPSVRQIEKSKAALEADLKYLYSAFTKIPCLKLAPDHKAKLVEGYEEFPFDTAVPLLCFKNVSALEITDIDIRQFFGWDQLAERLRSLSVRKGSIEDVGELIISIVLDDMDKRRRRSAKPQYSPIIPHANSGTYPHERTESSSAPPSPKAEHPPALSGSAPASHPMSRGLSGSSRESSRPRSSSPARPSSSRNGSTATTHHRSSRMKRSGSGGSHSSSTSTLIAHHGSSSDIPAMDTLPSTKWRFLRHLCLAENNLMNISTSALAPLAGSLTSLDLSSNLFSTVPDAISILSNLRALNLANNSIDSLHSLTRTPLPAITAFNLRANRLSSLAGIERLLSLERVDLRDNALTDPTELARLTSAPHISEIWIAHNPFTKTHPNYRITIFNLFRSTPGYTEDVILDGSGPGMVERRNLIDRVAEPPNHGATKTQQASAIASNKMAPVEVKKKEDPVLLRRDSEKSIQLVNQSQVAKARKKGGRRRVVELTRDDPSPNFHSLSPLAVSPNSQPRTFTPIMTVDSLSGQPGSMEPASPRESDTEYTVRPPTHTDQVDWELRGDEYKKRIEALKNEVGSGWLTVLSEEGWDTAQGNHRQYSSESITPPPNQTRTSAISS